MRSEAFKTRIVKGLHDHASRADAVCSDTFIDMVKMLPVVPAKDATKKGLLKELMDADRASRALAQRIRKVATALERLPLDESRKTIAKP